MDNENILELLRRTRIEVAPETFTFVSVRREDFTNKNLDGGKYVYSSEKFIRR